MKKSISYLVVALISITLVAEMVDILKKEVMVKVYEPIESTFNDSIQVQSSKIIDSTIVDTVK